MTDDRLIGLPQVIYITSLKKTAIYGLIKNGELKPIKLGRKTAFLESEVIAWVNRKIAGRLGTLK
jgi:predicted DNA-binding transcriptional regulator AlpA